MKQNKVSGVYKITNIITGDFYIGSSKNIKDRWAKHKSPSMWIIHPNVKLYQAFIEYELNNFTFEILELVEETTILREKEQYYIEQLKPSYNDRRANGFDRMKYHKIYRDKELDRMKKYNNAHRTEINNYYSRLCFYNNETLTLNALKNRFMRQGILHPVQEAKKYLLNK